ncbi:hypothetical protein DL771_009810 [Monosporascus sp. 5C6A]|nr:hypothetical protein DL771_009810 [Monosporascus sp. 5C6A]
MAKEILSTKITLSYPLYVCDWVDADQLVVGGGGGSGRNGVGNKITLLDASNPTELSQAAELELRSDEDNPTSLAVGPRRDGMTTVFAGINSGLDDIKKGRNQNFRVFGIETAAKKTSGEKSPSPDLLELKRESLFMHKDGDTYQRLLRLSPPFGGRAQVGAAATGFSKEPQIALFDVPVSGAAASWKHRGWLDIPKEAMDLDVCQKTEDTYQLAYCDDHDIFTVDVSKEEISDPRCVYSLRPEDGSTAKPAFRSLRYLTPGFLVTVVNKPGSGGVALQGYRLPSKDQETARLAIQKSLPKSVSKATGLAVRNLSPPSSPTEKQHEAQFVIAVAGNDSSISLFTMEHKSALNVDLLANLVPLQTIKSAHASNITGLSFSVPPKTSSKPVELSVKLASVAVGFTTVVHSIPLKKHIDQSTSGPKESPSKPSRYVVAIKSKGESPMALITVMTIVVLIMALVGQSFMEAKSITKPILGVKDYLPASWTVPLRKLGPVADYNAEPVPVVEFDPSANSKSKTIGDLLADVKPEDGAQNVVIKHDETGAVGPDGLPDLHVGVHDEEVHGPATSWDDLDPKERNLWKQRLKKTGHWVEDMGETIFKGVLFGEIGGAIGNIMGEAL